MFSFFRRGFTAKIMLVFLGLALFAMVVTGFGTGGGGLGDLGSLGSSNVATVGGEPVKASEVSLQLNRQLSQIRQQQPEIDIATLVRGGAVDKLVSDMITNTALLVFARDQGLGVSTEMVNREIARVPDFHNVTGQFDPSAFQRWLAANKLTEAQFRKNVEDSLIQNQLLLPVLSSPRLPDGLARQYASLMLERRSGTVGLVPSEAMGPGKEPSSDEIATHYKANQARYAIPERRVLRYATFGLEQVAAGAKPSDAEIADFYKRNAASYGPTETRTLSQIVLPDEQAARAFAAKLAAGTPFARAAADAGFTPADTAIGQQSKEAFAKATTAAVANAAFAAAQGATTAPVKSELGWHIVQVDAIVRTPARPLAEARGEIAAQLGQHKLQEAMADLEARIQDEVDEGSSLEEIAKAHGLTVRETAPITGTGAAPGNPGVQTPPEVRPLLETAFDMAEDEDPVVEPIQPGALFALLQVARIVPAAPPSLAQIGERVKADLVAKRASDRARAVAGSVLSKINAGMPVAQAFAEADVRLPPVSAVTARRLEISQDRNVPPPLAMLFSLPRGKARLFAAPNGAGWFIVHLDKVVPGDIRTMPSIVQAVAGNFGAVLGNEYAHQFVRAIETQTKVKRNDDAVAKLKAQLSGTAAQ